MNREIKFRAWNIEKKIMAEVGDWNWSGKVHVSYKVGAEKSGYFFGGNSVGADWGKAECALMQFTGLKDKNGKEIYEGDILQRGVVTFSRGKFQGTYFDGGGDLAEDWEDDLYQEKGIEVLGNIYENPELLKDSF